MRTAPKPLLAAQTRHLDRPLRLGPSVRYRAPLEARAEHPIVARRCAQKASHTVVRQEATMKRFVKLMAVSATTLALGSVSASAGPCSQQIATLSKQMAASDAGSGTTGARPAPTTGDQKGRHPPTSVMGKETEGKATSPADVQRQTRIKGEASSALALARKLDAQGRAECRDAMDIAERLSKH